MKLLTVTKDGGDESTVWAYWLVELKRWFSIALLCFENGSRDAFHTHAFRCVSFVLWGKLPEQHRDGRVIEYTPGVCPVFTRRETFHKVVSLAIAAWYNSAVSPAYKAWNTAVNLKDIRSLVNLQNFTPTDAAPASPSTDMTYQNRALQCQLKQANAHFLINGEGTVDCSPLQYRQSFNDCMTSIPSGASGANQNAGWGTSAAPGAVRLAMQRSTTNAEKLYAVASTAAPNAGNVGVDTRGGNTNPDTLVVIGSITSDDVQAARELP